MVRPPLELPDNLCRHMSKKTPSRRCLLGIQPYIVGYSGTIDWQTKRPERRVSKPHPSSCLHGVRFFLRPTLHTYCRSDGVVAFFSGR
jgi:hypothetical protein